MQFLVLAYDGTDAEALARRRAVRGIHFEGIKRMVGRGAGGRRRCHAMASVA